MHPGLSRILTYYGRYVAERVIITNGLLMNGETRDRLLTAGATGFAFSIDSIDPVSFEANRGLPATAHARILENLWDASVDRRFELGVNAVVTSATACPTNVQGLLSHAAELKLDYVKFQPVFDDGYLGGHAPHLALSASTGQGLRAIFEMVSAGTCVPSNSPEFWLALSALAAGEPLSGSSCGLGEDTALLVDGRLTRCYWVPSSDIGSRDSLTDLLEDSSVERLQTAKPSCAVDSRCFCMQPMGHRWSSRSTL